MLWFYLALGTSVLWGLSYVLAEIVLNKGVSPAYFMLFANAISLPIYFIFANMTKTLKGSHDIAFNDTHAFWYLFISALCFVVANLMIFMSVNLKNASYASIVEITYPIFTILFTWLILKDFHLNTASIIGTIFIMGGVALIYAKG